MSPALNATTNDYVSWKPLHGKGVALGEYGHHLVDFGLAEVPVSSFWPVMWALLLNRCGVKRDGLLASMGHLVQHDGDWTVQPLTVTMDPQATVANVANEGVFQGNPVLGGEKSFHTDTLVSVVANGEVADEDLLSEVAQCMAQWDLVLGFAVVVNKKSTQQQAHFVYRPDQIPSDTVAELADQFLRVSDYVNQNGLSVPLANVLEFMGEPTFTLPLYRCQPLADCNLVKHEALLKSPSEPAVASTKQTRIWQDSQNNHRRFYHLVVIRGRDVVDSARVQSAIHRLVKQFPILVSRFVVKLNQVLRYEAIDASNLVTRVTIDETLLNEPDKLRSLLHDAHRLDDADHPLFSVVELVPNGNGRIEWLSVYCHYVLGDQNKFHCWVEQLQNLISNPSAVPLPLLHTNDYDDGSDPTEFWKIHFSDDSLYLDLDGQPSQPLNHTCHANRYETAIPSSLVSHLPLLLESMSVNHLELLQGFMALFLLRLARQSSVALFGQADHNSVVPWVAQTTGEISAKDALHSLVEQYRRSTQYDWTEFSFPEDSRKPTIRAMALSMLPGCVHDFDQPYAQTPLSLTWFYRDDNSALKLVVDYDKGVYQMATVERLVKNFLFFTSQCCVDITQYWRSVGVVHPDEQIVLLDEFAITKHDYDPYDPMAEGVLDLFIRNVRQYPESVAVECGNHRETYRSLYEKVQALVAHFQSTGIQRQERIAVIVESNDLTIMALLALWTFGAVYVPIDSHLPQERQQYMMETAGCTRVLSTTFTKPDWKETIAIQDVLDSISSNKDHVVLPDTNVKHLPDEIAYIVFTSGTTGKPKGIIVHYGAFNNLIVTHPLYAQECPRESRWLLELGVAFDAYLYGMFLSLCYGWTLVLASHEIIMDVLPTIHGIYSTPSFISALDPENYPRLKWILTGGEVLPQMLSDKWSPHCRWYNAYGPAETTAVTTIKEIKPDDRVTIGRPLPNYECYILDSQLELLPIGTIGEIYIGGAGVSKGYIHRPELNETRFLPNPFAAGRLYRTGDYGRWLPNGELECLGRLDDQVKVRGFRVELGEVRGALLKQPGVRDAFVILVDGKQLAGFVISHLESGINEDTLRRELEKYLPPYMVPHYLVLIHDQAGFPRTVNGKVDQVKLCQMLEESILFEAEHGDYTALTDVNSGEPHRILRDAVLHVLNIEKKAMTWDRSFVQLGGDSISAIQLSSKCRQSGWSLSVSVIMKIQPIRMTADSMTPMSAQPLIERPMVGYGVAFPFTPIQQWFFGLPMDNIHRWSMSVLVELTETIPVDSLTHALRRLVDHHDMLRGSFTKDNDSRSWTQQAMPPGTDTYYPDVQLLTCPDEASLNTVTAPVQCGMNITHGSLIGAALVTTDDSSSGFLYLTIHHVVIDLVSWSILMEDLHQLIRDPIKPLEEVGYSFMDWAVGVDERVVPSDPATKDSGDPFSDWYLPIVDPDRLLLLNTEANARYRTIIVPHNVTSVLLHPENYTMGQTVQPIELLLTAVGQALATVTSHPTVTIHNESHGRHPWSDDIDISRTIGWFTTVTAVRVNSVEVQSTNDWIRQVKHTLRSAPSFAPILTTPGNPLQVVLNFVGNTTGVDALGCQGQAPWVPRLDLLPNHPTTDPHEPRTQILEITGTPMGDGELEFTFAYCPQVVSDSVMDEVIHVLQDTLRNVAKYHQFNEQEPYYTPSDFPLLRGVPLSKLDEALHETSRVGWIKEPTDLQDVYPMLPMQQGLLSISARDPSQYIVQIPMTITGVEDSVNIHQALKTIVTRYDILRTRFLLNWSHGSINGLQVVTRDTRFPWKEVQNWEDIGATSEVDFMHQQYQAGLDITSDSLLGFTVKQLGTRSFRLIILLHHALLDGWSGGLMLKDLKSLLSNSEIVDINTPTGRFRDFVERYYQKDLPTSQEFWTRYLAGVQQATHLTLPRPTQSLQHLTVHEHRTVLTSDIPQLQHVLTPVGVTLYSLVKATWALVLSRYSGQLDVVFANTVSGRSLDVPGVESIVGCLINTLPCRIIVDENSSVVDFLRLIEKEGSQLVAHEHCPIPLINSWLQSTLDCHVNDLFNTFLVLGNFPVMNTEDDRVRITDVTPVEFTEYAVTVMVDFFDQDLVLRINYDQRKYDDSYATGIFDGFVRVFNGLVDILQKVNMGSVSESGCLVREVPLFSIGDRIKLTQSMPAPTCAIDATLCVHDILRQEAYAIGDYMAIEYGDSIQWTYSELYQRSQYIAYGLLASGVKREEPVGLVIDRHPSAIAAMFGILMAGAAYVPMNADFPVERIRFIVQDCGIRVVLTNTSVDLVGVQVLDIDTLMNRPAVESPLPQVKPTDLSHIIYTSGTTGNPKGVQQEHRTVANYVQQPKEVLGIVPGLRMMQSMSLASDCSTIEVFGGLCNGVTLVLRTDMLDTLAKVDTVMLTPSVLATIDPSHYPNIRRVLVGGEALPLQTAERWAKYCQLFNVYGPSECFATHAIEYRVGDPVTIGRVIGNIEAYILDDQLRLVPFGVPGEIFLGGIGLTRGYVNRPELNQTKFVTNPFNPDGGRLYRSGDLGRWLVDGTVEYFARKDDQVKIRGYRVEPQEVEAVLVECPGVVSAAVLPHDGKLYGFCSPESVDIRKINEYLDQRLPPYMVPQNVFSLESIPLTVVGKIDKYSLNIMLEQRLAHSDERVVKGPTNPTELAIHEAMGEALDISLDHIDVRDSFFQLGGDSILAIRFSSLCRECGIQLSIAQIFRYKSVASLAELVSDVEITDAPLPLFAPWELTLFDYGSKYIPTEAVTFVFAEELLSVLSSTLSSVVQTISVFNSRYDSVGRRLVHQPHPVVIIEQDVDAPHRLDPSGGVWLSGTYTRQCNGFNVVTLVAHLVPLGQVGGWSTILQGLAKQSPDLAALPNPVTMDTLLCIQVPKYETGAIHELTMPYSGNPFIDDLLHSGLHAPLSVVIMAGFLMALQKLQAFDSVGIVGPGHFARYLTKRLNSEESTSHTTEFQHIKQWYYDQLVHGDSPDKPETPILYHYSDVCQPHDIPLVEQRTSFWDTMYGMQAAVIYQPSALVLQLCHHDATVAESVLATWKEQVSRIMDIPNQLRGIGHAFIPADFPHLAITSNGLDELMSEIHQDLGIPPATVQDVYPLSTMQQNFVVNTLRDPTSYIVQHVFRITGALDLAKYRAVWDELGLRHTILRTKFLASRMVQVVTDRVDIDWLVSDVPLSTSNEEYQHTARQLGFDLFGGHPLLRIHLFPAGDGHGWLCFMAIHHAVIDGWSYQLLMNESLSLYHDLHMTAEVPYRQFIDSVSKGDIATDKKYWTEFLEAFESTPDLPFPHLTQVSLYRKDAVVLTRTESLRHLCRRWGITFNVLLRGVWALMLTQYLGKPNEVTFGVMVSGRDGQINGLDRLVGPTINTLPFRAKVDPQKPVVEWLQELAEHSTQLLEHEQTSLVDIKRWAGLDADDQLFRSMIAVGRYLESGSSVENSLIEYHSLTGCNDTEYPLMASFDEPVSGGALHLTILARHEPFYVDGLIDCIGHLLTQFVAVDPSLLSMEALLQPSPTALSQVQAWIPGPTVIPRNPDVVMVPDLFTQHLAHQPQQVALETKDGQYTYLECYSQACRIGRALVDHGLQPGDKVALLFTQSAHYFIAVLGTWLVGGVAVPMDATNAPIRLQSMVDSLGEGSFLVTRTADDSGQVTLPDYYTAKIVVDNLDISVGSVSDLPPFPQDPTALALIIHTSGTTGVPKGVMLRHESIMNYISYVTQFMSLSSTSKFLQVVNIAFDGCYTGTLSAWSVGGALVLQDGELVDDMKRVTHCFITPSLLGVLYPEKYPQIVTLACGGEALSYTVTNKWLAAGKQILNLYGPTEITMSCHFELVPPQQPISIGKPISNTICYILNDEHNMVPPGVPGQICIAGIGVSSGYWQQLELTASAFIDNPFGSGKLYFTGDLGCWLPNGKVHYIGRKDNQVKLRGFRIELGEVESWCERLNFNIQQAVAVVVNKQLVVYLSPQSVDVDKVKESLRKALPYYMVPTHIIPLEAMPKTRNGKVDRRALAEHPLPQTLTSDVTYVDDASEFGETYRLLAGLALQALQFAEDHPLPAPTTSFFAIGGDSISAVSFSTLCRKQGLNVTVAKIFTLQTLGAIATDCETDSAKDNGEVQVSTLTRFQRWLNEEQRGSTDMVVEVQDPDQTMYVLKQPLGFTSANEWQNALVEWNSTRMEIGNSSESISNNEAGLTAEWIIPPSIFHVFTADTVYGQYQCTLSELLLAGFLMAWWKTHQGNVGVDLFRLTDNELVNIHWQQDTLAENLQSPLTWLQCVKEDARNATWSDISGGDNGHPRVLFHMVDPVVGMNIVRQRQQRLVPLLGARRRYDLEAMAWYHMDGTVTLVIHNDCSTNCETEENFVQALPTLWKHAMQELLEYTSETAWLPGDFPLVSFEHVQQLAVEPTRVQTVWPLSSLQQGFVIESLKDPSAYMVQLVYELHGVLDVDRYHQAWLTVGQRHDAMRVQFYPEQRVQVVMRNFSLEWSFDVKNLSDADIPDYLLRMRERGFADLSNEPLLRAQLLQQNESRHLCFITIHHAVLDAWSIDIVLEEVQRIYHGLALTTTPVSYAKFLNHVAKVDPTQAQSFWKEYLHGVVPTPDLPMPKLDMNPVGSVTQQLSTPLSSISACCGKLGITVNSLVRGLWALLLGRYLGQDTCEVTFAVMVTGRNGHIDGVEGMVGLTVNTVPFRVKLERAESVDTWLKAINAQSGPLMDHGHIGLLDIETWTNQKSPFQSMLVNSKSRTGEFGIASDTVADKLQSVNKGGYNQGNFPLTVAFSELPDKNGLEVKLLGNHGEEYYAGLITYLDFCVSTLVKDSDTTSDWTLGRMLNLVPSTELNRIATWSKGTHASYDGKPRLVHELVTRNNEECKPTDIALESLDSPLALTYGEMISQSQLVAQYLLASDIPGQFVFLFFRHSSAFLVAMLGTLMAGKTCVPMNVEHASERLVGMIESLSEAHPVVLTSKDHFRTAQELFGDTILCLDEMTLSTVTGESLVEWTPPHVKPSDIAMVYFTSGSTGKPKAVPQRHESIANYILGMSELMTLSKDCRCLQAFNIGFDGSLLMLFTPLYSGGTLVLHGDDLIEGLSRTDTWMLTPSMLQAAGDPEQYPGLRTVLVGGEPLSHALTKKWSQAYDGQLKFINGYGPTETTVGSHTDVVHTRGSNLISIGRTLPNVQCYILDDDLHTVPVGVMGEICIGGIGVSHGYLNDERRSRDVFVSNPFESGILYRTGDLGCWLPDGKVHCMGRKDNQIKLRGFRVELGELESSCERLNFNIQQAVALVVNKQLVMYVSPQSVNVDKVKEILRKSLPYYMVPTHVIPLDDIPKTQNGKVDRRVLAEYPLPQTLTSDVTYLDDAREFGETYRMVAHLALQALQFAEGHPLPAPSVSFFTLGGDSISAVSFSSMCRKQGLNVTVAKIFTLQTLGAIATDCETDSAKDNGELQVSSLTRFQRWLNEEQRGSTDMVVAVQDPDQTMYVLKQPLGFTSANEWQNALVEWNSTRMEIGNSSESISTNEAGLTAEWIIPPSIFHVFTADTVYGQYQCTLSELLLAGFLMAWWKTHQGNVDVDLFRLTDNELVNIHWQQDTLAENLQSPLAWLQWVKEDARNATWSDISGGDNGHPRVLFHMVDPVVGMNIIRQRQQRLVPLLGARRRYDLEAMAWYHMDGTVTLVIHNDCSTNCETEENFVQALPTLWKHAMQELLEYTSETAWLPGDFPLVSFEHVQQLAVAPTRVQTVWPLSSLQQGFVIESLKDPSAYMAQLVYELHGVLDVDRYHQAWLTVGQRHDAMRVQFHPDQSVQVIMRDFNLEWDYVERTISDAEVPGYLLRMRQQGFTDLTEEPLLRIQLLKQNSALHLCFITVHHAILDAWSIDVVLGELRRVYEGLTLATSAVSYGRFLSHTTKIDPAQTQSFWEAYLENMEPTPNLFFPTPENSPVESVTEQLTTSLSLVRTWCSKLGITVNSLVRGLWALLLGRYLGKDTREVTFGVMVTGRDGEIDGVDKMVGLTVNTVPFRVTLDRTQSVQSWLRDIHTQSGAMLSHSHVGLLEIEAWVNQKPLFQSMLVNDKSRVQGMEDSSAAGEEGLRWVNKGGYNQVDYPLTGSFAEDGEANGMHIQLCGKHGSNYYFSLAAYLNTVLETLIGESPSADHLTVGNLLDQNPRLEFERIQSWSQGTRALYDGKPRLVHDLVLQGKLPSQLNTVALVSLTPPIEFTYYELITRAQLVAQRLMTLDRSSRFVILFFERSPVFVLSMLGTLIAGKTCVPMDAAHTSERLFGMYESLGEAHPVVLTSQKYRDTAEKLFDGTIIYADDLAQLYVDNVISSDWNPPSITTTDVAFVYFTSGSTGKPKAVPERHESVVNYILGGCDILNLPPRCRFLQAMNVGFDSCLLELFTTFHSGGTVVLQSEDLMYSLGKVDACMLTPSMLQAVGNPSEYPDLRVVVTAGERLPFSLAEKWCQTQGGQVRLFNTYGPTETVVTSHFEHVTVTHDDRLVTIGRTLPNVQCYILDDALDMVPIGVIGEICIGGIGVCNRYLNDEQRSRNAFVLNPFGSGMLYCTGDLGCWLPDGRVYCMGRKDSQVKLHGFRVELGEVEQAIRNISVTVTMKNACVVYDHDEGKLMGYVTPSDVDSESVLSALWDRLPSYMVPDHIIPVDEFPLTSNGKVNRKALLTSHPPEGLRDSAMSPIPTMTPLQHQLVSILCTMLKLNPVKVHLHRDTFFTLGGNSLSAMHFVSRCKASGIYLAMADINRGNTLAALAKLAVERADEVIVELQPPEFTHGSFPLTPVQHMYFSWELTDLHQWPLPRLMKLTTPRSLDEWCSVVTSLVSHHDMLRARFDQVDGEWHGRVLPIDEAPVMVKQCTLASETDYWRVIDETHTMMNITTGPIYLAYVMNYRDTQYFYLTLHHLIADNTSMNILAQDISTLLSGKSLPYKTLPYAIWSQNLDGLRDTVSLEAENFPTEDELALPPGDVDSTPCSSFIERDQQVTSNLDVTTTLAMEQFGHLGISVEDIILTSLLLAYTDVFNCASIPLQYTSHGRNALGNSWDVSHTVGFFVNICPIVLRRKENDSSLTTLYGVQSILRGVSDFAVKYMLSGQTMKSPIAYNFLGKHDTSDSAGTNGVEVIDIVTSDEFQRQRVNTEAIPLIFLAQYTGECLTLMISYESNRYTVRCMSAVMEKWGEGVRRIVHQLKSQE